MLLDSLPTLSDADLRAPLDADAGFGALRTARGVLPLVALDVDSRIDGLFASIDVTQTFFNAHDQPLEATYVFPLPDRAAVTRFRLTVAGRVVEGDLQERGQARRTYDAAVQAGHRAAIAEEERAGVFTMRVGNLPPGERAVVQLSLVGPLPYSDGEVTFRFPLVVAPRYVPGTPLPGPQAGTGVAADTDAAPDASRISPPTLLPGFPNPVRLGLSVTVPDSTLRPHSFRSSLHAVVEQKLGNGLRLRVEPGERLDRDFVLRWRLGGEGVDTSLVVKPDATGGTFLLTLVPPANLSEKARPRDVAFVLDRSGSMSGWKMVAARRAVSRLVESLTDRDRFCVYAFDDRIDVPSGFDGLTLVPASDRQRYRAAEFLAGIDARGGTEMAEPLRQAAVELTRAGAQPNVDRVLVLITDGQVSNEDQILKTLSPHVRGVRIFTLGIDRAVNAAFLRRLADLGGGTSEVVESEARLDEVMDQIHRNVGTPVLTGLSLLSAGLDVDATTLVPSRLPDLFVGAPVVVSGRYRGKATGAVVVRALDADGEKWAGEVQAVCQEKAPLDKVWGRGRVRELEDRYAVEGGARPGLEREIVATSLGCGVLSRFTSYVAVDRTEVVNAGGEGKKVTQAVEMPAGWGEAEALAMQPPEAAQSATFGVNRSQRYGGIATGGRSRSMPAAPPPVAAAPPAPMELADSCRFDDCEDDFDALACTADFDEAESPRHLSPGSAKRKMLAKQVLAETEEAQADDNAPADRTIRSKSGGLLQTMLGFFGVGENQAKSSDATDLRTRAAALLARLDAPDAIAALRSTQAELYELVRDLLASGDVSQTLTDLANRVQNATALLAAPTPADQLIAVHADVVAALRAWLGLKPAGRAFWK